MAMELFVLSDALLNSTADWQSAIDREGYPLRLDGNKQIEGLQGFFAGAVARYKGRLRMQSLAGR
jgi:hypothetical protein